MARIPLIIDTDPGVDDALALVLAVQSPEVALRAVTATFGNADLDTTSANARRVLALAGRADVPVAAGAARPLVHLVERPGPRWHGADGLGMRSGEFPPPGALDPRPAVALMADVLRGAAEPVTIATIGPLTNLALLLARHPELVARIGRIVTMGGSVGGGAETNVAADPEAAHRVLTQTRVPVTLVPLDLTMRILAGGAWVAALAAAGPRCALLAGALAHYGASFRERFGGDAVALHDPVAVLEAVLPGTLRSVPLPVRVACGLGPDRGRTVPRPGCAGPPVHVAEDADSAAVLAEMLTRLQRLG